MKNQRLTKTEIDKITALVKSGISLNKIADQIGHSKTTVYYHFRKIKGQTYFPVNPCISNKESLGEFIGLFAGDGNFFKTKDYNYRVFIFFGPNETKRKEEVKLMLTDLFNKKPSESRRENLLVLYYCSKRIWELIKEYLQWDFGGKKTYGVCLKNRNHSDKFKIGFLRGNIDSDGHISKNKVSFASVSSGLINDIAFFLNY